MPIGRAGPQIAHMECVRMRRAGCEFRMIGHEWRGMDLPQSMNDSRKDKTMTSPKPGPIAFILPMLPIAAHAQVGNIGDMATELQKQAGNVADLIGAGAFLLGIVLAVAGLLKFKQHSQNPNDPSARLSSAFVLVFVGAALVAIPTTLGVGIGSLFGTGSVNVSVDGSLRSLN